MIEADEKTIRQYLLGELAEAEMSVFEERLMTDDELFEMLRVIEDELIDEAAANELSSEERARFDGHFLTTPDRRARLELSRALYDRTRLVPVPVKNSESGVTDDPTKVAESKKTNDAAVLDFPPPKPGPSRSFLPSPVAGDLSYRAATTKQDTHPSFWSSRRVYMNFAAAAAVILMAIGVWYFGIMPFRPSSDVSKGLQALNQAYREQRPTEARITDFDYAPPPPATRGPESEKFDYVARERAEQLLRDAVASHPDARSHHALGRLYLAEHELNKAVDQFDKALHLDERSAPLHCDYGVALMEMGQADQLKGAAGKAFEEFASSLEHLNRALDLDRSMLEALFNRALCKQLLMLYQEAEKDWQAYIEKDPNSKWADEARQKLEALKARTVQSSQNREQAFQAFLDAYKANDEGQAWKLICQSRDSTGGFIEDRLADAYLDSAGSGAGERAKQSLSALAFVGAMGTRRAHDVFVSDQVRFYESASAAQRESILNARSAMRTGNENYLKNNVDAALESYSLAKEQFERAGDACEATYAAYLVGSCIVQQSKAEAGLALLQPLARACEARSYRWLYARAVNAMCNAYMYLRDFSMAISSGNRSLAASEEIDDVTGVVKTRHFLGEVYRFVNNGQKALAAYVEGLSLAQTYMPQAAMLWRHYASLSLAFDQLGHYAAAVSFQKEALQLAIDAAAPRQVCRSYNFLGFILAKHGDYAEAVSHIQQAVEIAGMLPGDGIRIDALAYSFLQLGYAYRKLGEFDKAIESYDRSVQSYGELHSAFFDYLARKDKLLCCMEHGGCPAVEQEMEAVLAIFEQHRAKILEEGLRSTFFDAEQTIYDVAMEFEFFQKDDREKAFEYSERSRGRALRDLIGTSVQVVDDPRDPDLKPNQVFQPLSLEEIRARMPERAQVLQYAVLKDHLLIWVVSAGGVRALSQSIAVGELNQRVTNFLQFIADTSDTGQEECGREAASLYDLLIKPVESWLDRDQVCIVPDRILNYLPFGALLSRESGKYFIENHRFVLSPSASVFILCSEAARAKELATIERLLSVGNPLFDSDAFPKLGSLQSAAEEATAIAECYGSSGPLLRAAAIKRRVMSEMERADVIHLATHAVADDWYPLRSQLLLAVDRADAAGSGPGSVLRAYEVYKLDLSRAKLVVLSACATAVQKYYGGEGMIGLARPFIAKRIPLVVASLWAVNTESTAKLMISFHRFRKRDHQPTAEALRLAQLEMLNTPNRRERLPYYWAAFVTIGGYANF